MSNEVLGQNIESRETWDMSDVEELKGECVNYNTEDYEKGAEERAEKIAEKRQDVLEAFHKSNGEEESATQNVLELDDQNVGITREQNDRQRPANQLAKKIISTTGRSALAGGACVGMVLAPYLTPVLLPIAFLEVGSIRHTLNGVNDSMFEVDKHNKITQTANPIPVLRKYRGKESAEIFMTEAEKLFDGLEPGETYSTRSHVMTYQLLRRMEKEGKIQNLQKEEAGESRLILEKLATGNFKSIFNSKKKKMYNITFDVAKN